MNAKTSKTSKTSKPAMTHAFDARAFASAVHRAEQILGTDDASPCIIVRTIAREFPTLPRKDVLTIAGGLGINLGTASRQFQETRSEMEG